MKTTCSTFFSKTISFRNYECYTFFQQYAALQILRVLNLQSNLLFFQMHSVLWWIISFGVSFGPIIVAGILGLSLEYDHDAFWASIYTSTSRILCSFAAAFGILGISNGIGGKLLFLKDNTLILRNLVIPLLGYAKDIFEWKPLYVLGRLSYCAYLVHIPLILVKSGQVRYPLYVNDYYLVRIYIINLRQLIVSGNVMSWVANLLFYCFGTLHHHIILRVNNKKYFNFC